MYIYIVSYVVIHSNAYIIIYSQLYIYFFICVVIYVYLYLQCGMSPESGLNSPRDCVLLGGLGIFVDERNPIL